MKKNITILLLSLAIVCNILPMENRKKQVQNIIKLEKEITTKINKAKELEEKDKIKKAIQVLESVTEVNKYKEMTIYWEAKLNLACLLHQQESMRDGLRSKYLLDEIIQQNINIFIKISAMFILAERYYSAKNTHTYKYYLKQITETLKKYQIIITKLEKKEQKILQKLAVIAYFLLGHSCVSEKQPEQAIAYFKMVIFLTEKYNIEEENKIEALQIAAGTYAILEQKIEALTCYMKILAHTGYIFQKAKANYSIGIILLHQRQKEEATKYLNSCINHTKQIIKQTNKYSKENINEAININHLAILELSNIYSKKKKGSQSTFYKETLKHIEDFNIQKLHKKAYPTEKCPYCANCPNFTQEKRCNSYKKMHKKKKGMEKIKNRFTCNVCGKEGDNLKKCGACKKIYYCSLECQKHDWIHGHKHICKKIQQLKKKK